MEQDIFGHLLDVEASAANLVFDAQVEADKRLAGAKAEAETEYKVEYDKIIKELEANFLSQKQAEDELQDRTYKEFDSHLISLKKDFSKFQDYLDTYFFGAE